jgi:hypothetical protein
MTNREIEEIEEAIIKKLEKGYFLIKKHDWILFLGGFFGLITLATFSNYTVVMSAVKDTGVKNTISEIENTRIESEKLHGQIDDFAKDIKNGALTKKMIKSLKSDKSFLLKIKGDQGEKGFPGAKGDSGVSTGKYGQYITLNNSSQKNTVTIGSFGDEEGAFLLFDKLGNEVIKIDSSGFSVKKDGLWVLPYVSK